MMETLHNRKKKSKWNTGGLLLSIFHTKNDVSNHFSLAHIITTLEYERLISHVIKWNNYDSVQVSI